jgi:hypothetical protein
MASGSCIEEAVGVADGSCAAQVSVVRGNEHAARADECPSCDHSEDAVVHF